MYKTKIAIPVASLVLLMFTSTFAFSTSYAQFAGQGTSASNAAISNGTTSNNTNIGIVSREHFDAGQIYRTNNMTVINPTIRNLVIIIPDNIGANRSSTPSWPTFLPASATIAEGMRVIWFNADVNATHNIAVRNSTGVINSTSIAYQNGSVYRFGQAGHYTYSDPSLPGKNGTINVVEPTSFNASSFTNASGAVGLFVIPVAGKTSFDLHLHKLGFNAISAFNFTTFPGAANNSTVQSADNSLAGTPSANGNPMQRYYTSGHKKPQAYTLQ